MPGTTPGNSGTGLDERAKLTVSVLLDEYKRMQHEIYGKIDLCFKIMNMQSIVVASIIPAAGALAGMVLKEPVKCEIENITIFGLNFTAMAVMGGLSAVVVFFSLLMHSLSTVYAHIYAAAAYSHRHIRHRICEILGDANLLEWESFIRGCRLRLNFEHTLVAEWIGFLTTVVIYVLNAFALWRIREAISSSEFWSFLVSNAALGAFHVYSACSLRRSQKSWHNIVSIPDAESDYMTNILKGYLAMPSDSDKVDQVEVPEQVSPVITSVDPKKQRAGGKR